MLCFVNKVEGGISEYGSVPVGAVFDYYGKRGIELKYEK